MNIKKRDEILLKLLKAHESANRMRSNNLLRDESMRAADSAIADTYSYVILLLEEPKIVDGLESNIDEIIEVLSKP